MAALKKVIEEKDLHISSLETRLEKLERVYQKEERDLKSDFLNLKERVVDTEIYNSKDTIILNNPQKLNGKPSVEVMVDFLNQFFIADIIPADMKACHFLGKKDESAIIVKVLYFGQKKT